MKLLCTKFKMSSSFHPQTDGQSERANEIAETTLRLYTEYEATEWDLQLPTVEFTMNNSTNSSTRYTPFFLFKGYHPDSLADLLCDAEKTRVESLDDWTQRLLVNTRQAQESVQRAQERMKKQYDKHHKEEQFAIGDKVLLSTGKGKLMKLSVPGQTENRKFRPKYIGPYRVAEKHTEVAYRLEYPGHLCLHPVFHSYRLRQCKTTELLTRPAATGKKALNKQGDVFKVEQLLRTRTVKRGRKNTRQYLVKWTGYPLEDATWDPDANLQCDKLKRQFWAENRRKHTVENSH